ncbi:hypothetical protein Tco_0832559 [Tanacetum coccineum]
MFSIQIHHGGTFHKYPGRRYVDGHVDIFDMVDIDLFTVIAVNRMGCMLWHVRMMFVFLATLVRSFKLVEVYIEHEFTVVNSYQSTPTKGSVCDSITSRSLPRHDSSTPGKDSVCEFVTPRCMPHGMLTHSTDEFVIMYTQLIGLQGVDIQDHVIEDVMRQLSFEKTELDGEAGLYDVAGSGIDSSGETQDEVPVAEVIVFEEADVSRTEVLVSEKAGRTEEHVVEQVIDGSSEEDVKHDEENEIVEPDVDVHLFGISKDVHFDNIGVTNLVPNDVLVRDGVDVVNPDKYAPTSELLGLDSAFMKGLFPGQVSAVVGLDSNSGIYLLAYALVEAESRVSSDLLLNNIYEVFNGKIVRGKDKPVITLLEYIREYCLKRIVNVQSVIDKCTGPLTPTATRIVEYIKKEAHLMKGQWNGGIKYQVSWSFGGNNVEANSSVFRQAQQAEPIVSQHGSGVGAVIGLFVAGGQLGRVVLVAETRNADGREMGDGIPTQSSATGGASEWFIM